MNVFTWSAQGAVLLKLNPIPDKCRTKKSFFPLFPHPDLARRTQGAGRCSQHLPGTARRHGPGPALRAMPLATPGASFPPHDQLQPPAL